MLIRDRYKRLPSIRSLSNTHRETPINTEILNSKRMPLDPAPSANEDPIPGAHDSSSSSVLYYAMPGKNRHPLPISANPQHNRHPQDSSISMTSRSTRFSIFFDGGLRVAFNLIFFQRF